MVVAVIAVGMMKVAIDEIVHMISMRHSFVAAARTVLMGGIVPHALVIRCAPVGIGT